MVCKLVSKVTSKKKKKCKFARKINLVLNHTFYIDIIIIMNVIYYSRSQLIIE